MITLYEPVDPVHDKFDVPEVARLRLVTESEHESPVAGLMLSTSETIPVNPSWPATVIVEEPVFPVATETAVGLAVMLKSWIV